MTATVRSRPVGKDDWFMLLAWLSSLGFTTASYISVAWGVGFDLDDAPAWWAVEAIKVRDVLPRFLLGSEQGIEFLKEIGTARIWMAWLTR